MNFNLFFIFFRPTTPGSCGPECKLAATIKIADGYEWSNSLLDPNTFEWQDLADKIKREVYFFDQIYFVTIMS